MSKLSIQFDFTYERHKLKDGINTIGELAWSGFDNSYTLHVENGVTLNTIEMNWITKLINWMNSNPPYVVITWRNVDFMDKPISEEYEKQRNKGPFTQFLRGGGNQLTPFLWEAIKFHKKTDAFDAIEKEKKDFPSYCRELVFTVVYTGLHNAMYPSNG